MNRNSKLSFAVTLALCAVFLAVMLFPASVVDAQLPTQLVPTCESAGSVENVCSICHIFQLVDNILKFIFALAAVGAIVMLLWGGFLMIMPWVDPNRYTRARKILTNAFIGVLIIFFSWLAVDTIVKILAQQTVGTGKIPTNVSVYGPWNQIPCDVLTVVLPPGAPGGPPGGPPPGPFVGGEKLSHEEALVLIAEKGEGMVSVKPGASLQGTRRSTVDAVIAFQQQCACEVVITSGTDGVHSTSGPRTHASGDKVDIRTTPTLLNFITTNYSFQGVRIGDGAKLYKSLNGVIYAIEANHVDVLTPL